MQETLEPAVLFAERDRLTQAFIDEADPGRPETTAVLAEALACAVIRHRVLFNEIVNGIASANSQRTYPAVLTQIQRLAKSLGVTVPKEHTPDFV